MGKIKVAHIGFERLPILDPTKLPPDFDPTCMTITHKQMTVKEIKKAYPTKDVKIHRGYVELINKKGDGGFLIDERLFK